MSSLTKSTAKSQAVLNPRTTKYEFMGPIGALLVTVGVPFVTYALYFTCNERVGACPPSFEYIYDTFFASVTSQEFWRSLFDLEAFYMYLGWYAFCVVAWAILPGDWVQGTELRNGKRQSYKINAFSTMLLALGLTAGYIYRFGCQSFTFLYERWIGFVTAALCMSIAQAALCYGFSFRGEKLLALGGNTGNPVYDFYIGRELNPAIFGLDLKSFNELRPGMILWLLIDISMACEQATRLGGRITDSMALVVLFHGFYIADSLYNEPGLFTMMDIVTDGFGFMLSVGDLLWVPFVYSLQARYLVFRPKDLGMAASAAIFLVNALGWYIFRESNNEKNDFRNGKNPKNLKFMETKRGTKLLTSGWWGVSRHPNYMGDLLMGLAWSLPTGFDTPVTYFYIMYFAVLLAHRGMRDDEACEKKYGDDWNRYKKLVKWRIIPFIY
ncbi:ERG4/ERG24 ergosterol biosynthesis protein [Vararia minispora EC-137]|uniref:ERG4/ERG24 ergosterol biosynthesis protein n=1 Tax=Vararia minispora EC-137 TaxID=1314806 RepID=A0ACB8Q6H6_9AGAM|nr:ERG4/ERG24 ergosterol biosynthesis protein [Vararia minispora EC-137]